MKLYLIAAGVLLTLSQTVNAQQKVKLSFKYQPQHNYISKINLNVSGSVNAQNNSAIADSMKNKGLTPNTKLALTASGDIAVNTGAEANGLIPITMTVDHIDAKPAINGQQFPVPSALLNGKKIYAKSTSTDGKLSIDSVSGKHLPDSALNHINNMLSMMMNRMQLPDKTFKAGDTFTQTIPFDMPMPGMKPVNATTKVTYHLVKIEGNKAYFDLTQNTALRMTKTAAVPLSTEMEPVAWFMKLVSSTLRSLNQI